MNQKEISDKYRQLVNTGQLPLIFKQIDFEDPATNHELQKKSNFYSPKFNTRVLGFRYSKRAFLPL